MSNGDFVTVHGPTVFYLTSVSGEVYTDTIFDRCSKTMTETVRSIKKLQRAGSIWWEPVQV